MSDRMTPEAFTDRLRDTRDARGYSQTQLAERCGLQPSAISHFETGARRPSFANLCRLADALGVTTDYLVGRVVIPADAGPDAAAFFRDFATMSRASRATLVDFKDFLVAKERSDAE